MECRLTCSREGTRRWLGRSGLWRWVGPWSLALTPLLAAGCYPQSSTLPITSPSSRAPTSPQEDQANQPKRVPKPNTILEAGKLRELKAEDPKISTSEKAMLLDQARKAYQQALKLDPNFIPAARAMAALYVKENDYPHALATYQNILQSNPQDAPLWHELAMCQAKHKDFDGALESLYKALELDPESRPYLTTYGHLLARSGRYDEATAHFSRLIGPSLGHYQVARMQFHMQRNDLARVNLQKALQENPNLEAAQQLLAAIDKGVQVPAVEQANFEE